MSPTVIPLPPDAPHPYQPMLTVALAIGTGILADRFLVVYWSMWLFLALLALVICMTLCRRNHCVAVCALLVSMATLAATWHQLDWRWFPDDHLAFRLDEENRPVCLEAVVLSSPRLLAAPQPDPLSSFPPQQVSRLKARISRARDGRDWVQASGEATLMVMGDASRLRPGDLVRLLAFARRPPGRLNPGVDLLERMRSRREIFYLRVPSPAAIQLIGRVGRWSPRTWMEIVRARICRRLQQQLGPVDAPLAEAMLVGAREQVTSSQRDAFFLTGTIHLLAISGLHVGVLAGLFWLVTRAGWVDRRLGLSLAIAFVFFYCWLTGGHPPIMRASILVTVLCLSELCSRPALPVNTLATAALLVLLLDPSSLFQAGTQLSFVAVLGLVRCRRVLLPNAEPEDPIEKLLVASRPRMLQRAGRVLTTCRRASLLSFAAWSITAPLVLYYFHLVSPVGILLALVLGIPLAVVLVAGMTAILLSPLGWVSKLAVGPLWLGLKVIRGVVALARDWPGAYFWSPAPAGWQVAVLYCLLFLGWSSRQQSCRRLLRISLVLWVLLAGISTTRAWKRPPGDVLRATFISVGHGTSVLLELPGGRAWLYDAGHLGDPDSAGRQVASVLWSRGIRQLDQLLLSHADVDHFNAIPYLLERFRVRQLGVPVQLDWTASPATLEVARALKRHQVEVRCYSKGDRVLPGKGPGVRVLHPPAGQRFSNDNAASLVVELTWGASRLLLPGDLEADGLEMLVGKLPRPATVLMAPHHGSLHSDPLTICDWCRPRLVVISSGHQVASGEPLYRQWGVPVVSTREQGAITVDLWHDRFSYRHQRRQPP